MTGELEGPRTAKGEPALEEPTRAEQALARRSAESRATVPDVELRDEVDMTACVERHRRGDASITAMLVRACALALREVPRANGSYRDGRFELYPRVNVSVTLGLDGPDVLATILDADRYSVEELDATVDELTGRVQAGELTAAQLSGATFTLWDVGRHGVASASVPLQAQQAAAIVAGSVRQAAAVRDGRLESRQTMTLTLVCDHRILNGAQAAAFLLAVKKHLERAQAL